jgi:hypothetical protein
MRGDRPHGWDAAGGGNVGGVMADEVVGPCPSCGAELLACRLKNPVTGRIERALMHPVPFCTYYGETDPVDIERDIKSAQKGTS